MVALAQALSRSNSPGIASSLGHPRPRTPGSAYPRSTLTTSGSRFYNPGLGRWLSRDPIAHVHAPVPVWSQAQRLDTGRLLILLRASAYQVPFNQSDVLNPYGFVDNDSIDSVDMCGLMTLSTITVKRKDVLWFQILKAGLGLPTSGADKYGHWWMEFDGESYGWWPKNPVGLLGTIFGVPGELNGQTYFGASGFVGGFCIGWNVIWMWQRADEQISLWHERHIAYAALSADSR